MTVVDYVRRLFNFKQNKLEISIESDTIWRMLRIPCAMYDEVSTNCISILKNHCTIFMNAVNLH